MNCTSPTWLKAQQMYVPCGWCTPCLIRRRSEWATRMMHEAHYWEKKAFITLTYADEYMPYGSPLWPTLKKEHMQLWVKRLRKRLTGQKIKYYICGEYGPKYQRPHYHGILYGIDYLYNADDIMATWQYCDWSVDAIRQRAISDVTVDRCLYVAQYVLKKIRDRDDDEYAPTGREAPWRIQSNGLGRRWAEDNEEYIRQRGYITVRGTKQSIPRYYLKRLNIDAAELCSDAAIDADIARTERYVGLSYTEDELYNINDITLYDQYMRECIARNHAREMRTAARLRARELKKNSEF